MVDSQGGRALEEVSGDGKERLRLVIADPHQLFRDCLADVLAAEQELAVVGKFASAQEALPRLGESRARILLLGFDTLGDGAPRFIREVRARHPELRLILLGRDEADDSVLDCLEAGASGYVMRGQPLADLRSAIDVVVRGEVACTPRLAHSLYQRLACLGRERRRREKLDFLTLTPRELEILRLIADDLSNQEIAHRLFLSVHTVKNHVHKILETIGVHSRWAAVRHAIDRGWIGDRRRR
ncbi:MAG TPA: response regulator transcription factor [Thermoanaerobaculia bacterium]|nr:response regulator transcription factor [Thermoanaerobaculia bacterium]